MITENKKIESLILGISIFAFLLFLGTAFNSFYWMDDFWKKYEMNNQGFFEFQKHIYLNLDGRAISPVYSLRNYILYIFDYKEAWIVVLIGMMFLLGIGYFLVNFFLWNEWRELDAKSRLIYCVLVTMILVMVFRPHISRSLYWGTGIYYMISSCFLVGSIYYLIKYPVLWVNFLMILIVSTSGPNNGLSLFVFLLILKKYLVVRIGCFRYFAYLILSIISLMLIVLSPGTFQRSGDSFDWSVFSMVHGFFIVLKEYLGMSLWAIIGGVFLGLVFELKEIGNKLRVSLLCLILGATTVIPFSPIPIVASKHTSIFFQIYFLAGVVFFTGYILHKFNSIYLVKMKGLFIVFFLLVFSYQIFIQLYTGRVVKIQIDKRFKEVELNRGSNKLLILNPIEIPDKNWVSRFWDMEDDPNNFFNQSFQKYFNTGNIIVK